MMTPVASDDIRAVFGAVRWIWHTSPKVDNVNAYMQARRTFRLAQHARCVLRITADSRYRLYVNGAFVCRGPARGFQEAWPYDEVDISKHLTRGVNVLAVMVHSFGVSTTQYLAFGAAGLLVAGKAGTCDLATGSEWKVRPAPGYERHLHRQAQTLGFQEHVDARRDDAWLKPGYDDCGWALAERGPITGSMPWPAVEPRGIPMLREEIIRPEALTAETVPLPRAESRALGCVATDFLREKLRWQPATSSLRRGKASATFRAAPAGRGGLAAWVIDFGREVVGSVRLDVLGAAGGEVIDMLPTERLLGYEPAFARPWYDNCFASFGNRLTLRRGRTTWEQFDVWGLRYLVVAVRGDARPLKIGVSLRQSLYPMEVAARFESSDARLDGVYRISAWTQQCCMLDAYVDCPWREQAQWWGDARVQGQNTFYLSADARLFARGIGQIARQQIANGLTYGHAPTSAHNCILPDFTLTWVMTLWDHYWQTGDPALFARHADAVRKALEYYHQRAGANGLVPYDDRYWLFLDWADLFRDGFPTIYNLQYLAALRAAAELSSMTGGAPETALYARRAGRLERVITSRLFDRRSGTFYGGLDWKRRPVEYDSAHAYALAIMAGLEPRRHAEFAEKRLLPLVTGEPGGPRTPSPFFMFYVFEALKSTGHGAEVVDCIRRWWGAMVDRGMTTTQENWDPLPGKSSLCHAWSAHPIVHLSNVLLGVTQTGAGWSSVRFAPEFAELDFARGAVATPRGAIECGWQKRGKRYDVRLSLPAGMRAEVSLAGERREMLRGPITFRRRIGER